eukprot:CAMPEP_0202860240 /NCGR_PEP_ID=MMETSP1391-20130828/2031_1 /ASSEMBLY_ACC=CAM_ASM_000867 /TAXON_ID=1034604 /ORGANISM="Chlamydomonas leiostraca, Strain SAG 11-49" /LENGTH=114 /DNA_ID=CAMNT_0049539381 /DNA_START=83 /DNA_END=423 /DNA_ORIENTATION=+
MPHFRPTGPISLQGAPAQEAAELPAVPFKVLDKSPPKAGEPVGVHPADLAALHACGAGQDPPTCFLQLGDGSDCVLAARCDDSVRPGTLALDEVQAFNLHILPGDTQSFRVFTS